MHGVVREVSAKSCNIRKLYLKRDDLEIGVNFDPVIVKPWHLCFLLFVSMIACS